MEEQQRSRCDWWRCCRDSQDLTVQRQSHSAQAERSRQVRRDRGRRNGLRPQKVSSDRHARRLVFIPPPSQEKLYDQESKMKAKKRLLPQTPVVQLSTSLSTFKFFCPSNRDDLKNNLLGIFKGEQGLKNNKFQPPAGSPPCSHSGVLAVSLLRESEQK